MTRNATALLSCSLAALAFAAHKNPHPASAALLWGSASTCVAAAVRMLGGEWHIAETGPVNRRALALGALAVLVLRPGRIFEPIAQIALIASAAVLGALGQGGKIDAAARALWTRLVDAPKLPGDQVLHGVIAGVVISLPLGEQLTAAGDPALARAMAAVGALVGPWLAGAAEAPPASWLPHAMAEAGPVLPEDLPPAVPPAPPEPAPPEPAAPEPAAPEPAAPEPAPTEPKPKPRLAFKLTKNRPGV